MALTPSQQAFVDKVRPYAEQASKATGIDPEVIIAQAALESAWGTAAPGENYFGIKGPGQTLATKEVYNGKEVNENASFRTYGGAQQSFEDWARLINTPYYSKVREAYGADNQVAALGASGYATDPQYASKIGSIVSNIPDSNPPGPPPTPRLRETAGTPESFGIPPGPGYNLIVAGLSGDQAQIDAAVGELRRQVIFGQTSLQDVTRYLEAVDQTSPQVAQAIKSKFDANPALWNSVPDEARASLQQMFADNEPPKVATTSAKPPASSAPGVAPKGLVYNPRPEPDVLGSGAPGLAYRPRPEPEALGTLGTMFNPGAKAPTPPLPRERPELGSSPLPTAGGNPDEYWPTALAGLQRMIPGLSSFLPDSTGSPSASPPSAPGAPEGPEAPSVYRDYDSEDPEYGFVSSLVQALGPRGWTMGAENLNNYVNNAKQTFEQLYQPTPSSTEPTYEPFATSMWPDPVDEYAATYLSTPSAPLPSAQDEYDAIYNNPAFNAIQSSPATPPLPVNAARSVALPPIPQTRPPTPDYINQMLAASAPAPVISAPRAAPAPNYDAYVVEPTSMDPQEAASMFGYDRPSNEEILASPNSVWYDPTQWLPDLGGDAYYRRGGFVPRRR